MSLQYIANEQGEVTSVQMPIEEWQEFARKAEAFDIAQNIRQGFKEAQQIERGELKAQSITSLLDELRGHSDAGV